MVARRVHTSEVVGSSPTPASMAKTEIPESIEVGPFTYTVTTDELARRRAEGAEKSLLNGHTDCEQLTIIVDPAIAPAMLRDTVLHETLHAIADVTGLGHEWGVEKEETIIRRLSPVLLDVIRRNPALVAYLTAA